jgi:hypothetical protein
VGAVEVAGPDRRRQPVVAGVGQRQRLPVVIERLQGGDRAEDLLAVAAQPGPSPSTRVGATNQPGRSSAFPPQRIVPPSPPTRSMAAMTLSKWACETSGPRSLSSSIGSPIRSASTRSTSASRNSAYTPRSTRMREPHRQICPEFWKAERTMVSRCPRQSLSANTRVGFLPPSSSETFFSSGAASPAILRPTAVLPVNETARTSSCTTSGSPAAGPEPCTMLSTPAGNPISAASSPSIPAVSGVTSEGLATTVLPAASAGATFQVSRYSGRFQGEMVATTPSGGRRV